MQFVSIRFLLFAAATLLLYYATPRARRWWILLAASYAFYFLAGPEFVPFILWTTAVTYTTAVLMQRVTDRETAYLAADGAALEKPARKAYRAREKRRRRGILTVGLILGFGTLAVLKYTGFVMSDLAGLTAPDLILPLGISFYTFQSMGYLIDVYRAKATAERNFAKTALFVSFFPQLIQGPISRFSDLEPQLIEGHDPARENLCKGLTRMVWGYFKKVVVADTAAIAVKTLTGTDYDGAYVALLILLYSAQIYGDFTGGIDITIGFAEMLGIRLKENFDRPFSSRSVKEYWRRWHITMGTWFTDYIFYPLSVSVAMQKLSKWSRAHLGNALGKRIPVYLATIVTWFLTGLWHGAGWNFIVWGLLNCAAILISQELQPLWDRFHRAAPRLSASGAWGCFQAIRTFLLMGLFRSLDVYRDVPRTFRLWGSMFTGGKWAELFTGGFLSLGLSAREWIVLLCGILILFAISQVTKRFSLRDALCSRPVLLSFVLTLAVSLILVFGSYGIGYDAGDFIYGQF